jgi:hypothetical protein
MNSPPLLLNPVVRSWLILLPGMVLLGFFVWKEVKRGARLLAWRIVAQMLVALALFALFLRPSYRSPRNSNLVLLLTTGYDKRIADSLLSKHPYLNSTPVSNAGEFTSVSSSSFVLGEGLPAYALDYMPDKTFHYYPANLPAGVTELLLKPFPVNHRSAILGEFNNSDGKTVLKLMGPAGVEDSVSFSKKGVLPFSLSFLPKQPGKFTYTLSIKRARKTVAVENIPIEILPEKKMNILFLLSYPTFEVKFLKNYLSARGHSLWLRYQLSKNIYKSEFDNRKGSISQHFTNDLFRTFDLLFIDGEMFQQMSPEEKHSLEDAVDSGLGIIILLNKIADLKTVQSLISLSSYQQAPDTAHLALPLAAKALLPTLPIRLNTTSEIQPVTTTGNGRILSGYQFKGLGKVGFQLLNETYSLGLKEGNEPYAAVWSGLLEQTARNNVAPSKIKITSPFPWYVNDPISVDIISSDQKPVLQVDRIPVPLMEDVTVNNFWHGKIWVGETGWHELLVPGDSTKLNFYVSAGNEWLSLSKAHQIHLNRLHLTNSPVVEPTKELSMKEISPLLFFALFILASGFLWLAPKL